MTRVKLAIALFAVLLAGAAAAFAALRTKPPTAQVKPTPRDPNDARTQYDLGRAIAKARSSASSARLTKTERSFAGRRYRWEAAWVPALCKTPERCFVAPFDHARPDAPHAQGWLLEIAIERATHAKIAQACAGVPTQCVVALEGRLDKLVLREDLPTAVGLSDVSFSGARAARPGESWIRRTQANIGAE
jgi:hypothetical protein